MNIDKDQILQLLRSQGKNDQASSELPGQIDTDNPSTPRCCPSTARTRTAWAASSADSGSSDPAAAERRRANRCPAGTDEGRPR